MKYEEETKTLDGSGHWSPQDLVARGATKHDQNTKILYLELLKKALTASIYEESGWENILSSKNLFKRFLIAALRKQSILLIKRRPFDVLSRQEGRDWPLFGYTMVGHRRLDNIQTCVEDVLANEIPGDFIETGAWRGGATIFMRAILKAHGDTSRKVWVADSFEGLPKPKDEHDGSDFSEVDYLKVSLEQVKANFQKFDLLDEQVGFLQGWFCDTLPRAKIDQLAILRLDGDMYSSTMDSLKNLYDKVSVGGYVIIDDYQSWESCRNAVTDFLSSKSIKPEIKPIDKDGVYWRVQ